MIWEENPLFSETRIFRLVVPHWCSVPNPDFYMYTTSPVELPIVWLSLDAKSPPSLGRKIHDGKNEGLADPRVQSVGVSFLRAAVRDSNGTTKDILQNLGRKI